MKNLDDSADKGAHRRGWWLAAAGLAAGLLLGEGLLALLAPQVHRLPEVWEHDPRLGWRHIPGSSGRLVTPEFDVEYRIDADGLRSHRPVGGVAEGAPRILLFGDSFAEGWGVEVEEGLAARLEAGLASHGHRAAVRNLAVAGYGTDQELLRFEQWAEPGADLVLVLFYGNDLWNNASRHGIGAHRGLKPRYTVGPEGLRLTGVPVPPPPARRASASLFLARHWHLFGLLRRAWPAEEPPKEQLRRFYGGLYARDQARYRPLWDLTEAILAAFARAARDRGAEFALCYAPAIVQIQPEDWRTRRQLADLAGADYDLARPNRRLAEIAHRRGIPYLDLYPEFAAAGDRGLFYRDSHWTPAGHELAARALAEFLVKWGLVPAGAAGGG